MYTIKNAATVLGVSSRTVKNWIAKDNIETTMIETDRKRIYLSYNDVIALADKHKPLRVNETEQEKSYPDLTGLYSLKDVVRLLGISPNTARKWMKQCNIEKKIIVTDKWRGYVTYSDLVTLAEKYNRIIAHDDTMKEQDSSIQEDGHPQEKKLYTVAETALFLGTTEATIRDWLSLYNIENKTMGADKRRIYITYSDILTLAGKKRREAVYPVNVATDIREMRSRLEKIEDGILKLEQYIKRSIYIGK